MLAQPLVAQTYFYLRDRASKKLIPITRAAESIGRVGASLSFPDDKKLSRLHCRLYRDQEGLAVCDMGSRNRTYVNESPITARVRHKLRAGDVLRIGSHTFDVVVEEFRPKAVSSKVEAIAAATPAKVLKASDLPGRVLELSVPALPRAELGLNRPLTPLRRAVKGQAMGAAQAPAKSVPQLTKVQENLLLIVWLATFTTIGLARRQFNFASFGEGTMKFVFVEIFVPIMLLGFAMRADTKMRLVLAAAMSLSWVILFR